MYIMKISKIFKNLVVTISLFTFFLPSYSFAESIVLDKNVSIAQKSYSSTSTIKVTKPKPVVKVKPIVKPKLDKKIDSKNRKVVVAAVKCSKVEAGIELEIEKLINVERLKVGAPAVKACKELRSSAKEKYIDIYKQNKFTHDWADGKSLKGVIVSTGYIPKDWGEILIYGSDFLTASDYVESWLTSSAHKKILLDPKYKNFGVAVGPWSSDGVNVAVSVAHFSIPK